MRYVKDYGFYAGDTFDRDYMEAEYLGSSISRSATCADGLGSHMECFLSGKNDWNTTVSACCNAVSAATNNVCLSAEKAGQAMKSIADALKDAGSCARRGLWRKDLKTLGGNGRYV